MASYVIDQPSYKQVTQKNIKERVIPSNEVIEPTYTEIDWESKMEQMRKSVIDECTKITTNLIDASEQRQKTQFEEFKQMAERTIDKINTATTAAMQDTMKTVITRFDERIEKNEDLIQQQRQQITFFLQSLREDRELLKSPIPNGSVVPFTHSQVNDTTQSNRQMVTKNSDENDIVHGARLKIPDDDICPSPHKKLCSSVSTENPLTPSNVNDMELNQENDV